MKLSASVQPSTLNKTEQNLTTLISEMKAARNRGVDLLLFGEAYLTGFEGMTFDYDSDIRKALAFDSVEIARIRNAARELDLAVGFGFHENDRGGIYSSYLVVGRHGEILCHYQRRSPGWKESYANADYREGRVFKTFQFDGKTFGVMVCGDFWEDRLLNDIAALDPEVDLFLWPVHTDYAVEDWNTEVEDDYREQTRILQKPVFYYNNYIEEKGRAKGGAYLWQMGKTLAQLPTGAPGYLDFTF